MHGVRQKNADAGRKPGPPPGNEEKMKILFAGTPQFAVPSLLGLCDSRHEVVGLVTREDRPRGRSARPVRPETKTAAASRGVAVFQPEDITAPRFGSLVRELRPDMIAVVAYGKMFPPDLLKAPPAGCVNVHASLLPAYRGAAPVNWAVAGGERETGVTTMLMDEGMDTGDILLAKKIGIGEEETAGELSRRLSVEGARLLLETVDLMEKGGISPRRQDERFATYAPRLSRNDGKIDWTRDASEIRNLVRGMNPWPCAHTTLRGKTLKIFEAEAVSGKGKPGEIAAVGKRGLDVAAGEGLLRLLSVQPEGGKRMDAGAFARGRNIAKGQFAGEQRPSTS